MSDKTPFERTIQEKLEGYQAPYDPSAWEGIEQGLERMDASKGRSPKKGKNAGKWAAIATGSAAILISGGLLMNGPSDEKNENKEGKEAEQELVDKSEEQESGPTRKKNPSSETKADGVSSKGSEQAPNKGNDVEKESAGTPSSDVRANEKDEGSGNESPENPKELEARSEDELVTGDLTIDGSSGSLSTEGKKDEGKNPIPTDLKLQADKSEGCPGVNVSFELSERPENVNYFWEFGDGNYSNRSTPSHRYGEAGAYRPSVTLTHKESGKTRELVADEAITVHRRPSASIEKLETPRDLRRARKVTVLELEEQENVDRVTWDLGDGTRVQGKQRVVHQFPSKGIYSVEAYLKGDEGCTDTVRFRHEQKKSYDRTLLAPNAFAPNGDGRNDRFIPKALKVLDVPFTMTIHDRSGKVVYKTNNASEPWNGRLQNSGQELKGGVYLWVVVLENKKGGEETYKDAITLKR